MPRRPGWASCSPTRGWSWPPGAGRAPWRYGLLGLCLAAYFVLMFEGLKTALVGRERTLAHPYWSDPAPCSMLIDEVEAIWAAIATSDDWAPFEAKIAAVRRFGEAVTTDAA